MRGSEPVFNVQSAALRCYPEGGTGCAFEKDDGCQRRSTIFEKAVRAAGAGVISLEEAYKFRDQLGQLTAIPHDLA
jgi:hypothetical protein